MGTLTVAIRGLSLVWDKKDHYDVLLNPAMGHGATLTILTRFLDPLPEASERWDPDRLGYIPVFRQDGSVKLEQVGIWDLTKEKVTFGSKNAAKEWGDRHDTTIAFGHKDLHYKNVKVKSTIPGDFSIVEIREGKPSAFHIGDDAPEFTLKNRGGEKKVKGTFEVRFTDVPVANIANKAGKMIKFEAAESNIFVVVSNLAKEPDTTEAYKHFIHYYDALVDSAEGEIADPDKFALLGAADEVYDCVPPGTVP